MKTDCFVCGKDITTGIKVLSYRSFPQENGAMCRECADKDLEVAHKNTSLYKRELKEQLREEVKTGMMKNFEQLIDKLI